MSLYELPPESELDFFIGEHLIQIGMGQYNIILRFSWGIDVTVEVSLTVRLLDGTEQQWIPDSPFVANALFDFIGKPVASVSVLEENRLQLNFDGLGSLTIGTSDDGVESYTINPPENVVIIV
ncbi:MAG: hypothetical protein K2X29_12545 [Candidatus Obscuribacterales bacterium]|nr:hypothetical protein [Candidatus Obscuribacterales bacterium]